MLELLNDWVGHPLSGMLAALFLVGVVYLAWRQFRDRERRRYYRQRERARREYWGFD
ncbi:MAG TPA: hypothetical protein VN578_21615 [Candidatus Binatia bacterium]|jgi:hypothetical protein|nr:hypothetical protein [Candidatus Binatia bacterium]